MLIAAVLVATVVGWTAQRLRVPGGMLVGAMIGAAGVALVSGREIPAPPPVSIGVFAAVGLTTGLLVTRDRLRRLAPLAGPAIASAMFLILLGVLVGYVLTMTTDIPWSVAALATSPGALSVMSAVALEQGDDSALIVFFHVVRVILVVLLVPVILLVRPRDAR